jgi:hypothetical protein
VEGSDGIRLGCTCPRTLDGNCFHRKFFQDYEVEKLGHSETQITGKWRHLGKNTRVIFGVRWAPDVSAAAARKRSLCDKVLSAQHLLSATQREISSNPHWTGSTQWCVALLEGPEPFIVSPYNICSVGTYGIIAGRGDHTEEEISVAESVSVDKLCILSLISILTILKLTIC